MIRESENLPEHRQETSVDQRRLIKNLSGQKGHPRISFYGPVFMLCQRMALPLSHPDQLQGRAIGMYDAGELCLGVKFPLPFKIPVGHLVFHTPDPSLKAFELTAESLCSTLG